MLSNFRTSFVRTVCVRLYSFRKWDKSHPNKKKRCDEEKKDNKLYLMRHKKLHVKSELESELLSICDEVDFDILIIGYYGSKTAGIGTIYHTELR